MLILFVYGFAIACTIVLAIAFFLELFNANEGTPFVQWVFERRTASCSRSGSPRPRPSTALGHALVNWIDRKIAAAEIPRGWPTPVSVLPLLTDSTPPRTGTEFDRLSIPDACGRARRQDGVQPAVASAGTRGTDHRPVHALRRCPGGSNRTSSGVARRTVSSLASTCPAVACDAILEARFTVLP